jgi:CHAT domain-containing protein
MNDEVPERGKAAVRPSHESSEDDMSAATPTFEQSGTTSTVDPRVKRITWAAAAVVTAVLIATMWWRSAPPRRDHGAPSLIVAMQDEKARVVEARLTGGGAWAPYRPGAAARRPLKTAAAFVLSDGRVMRSGETIGLTALAHLFLNETLNAARLLDSSAAAPASAAAWSDLAAAHLHLAVTANQPQHLGKALAAADAALRIDPSMPEALFNRALVVEHYGLRDLAREAWERYLAADANGGWADEARARARKLAPVPPFDKVLEAHYERLTADPAAAREFVRQYPQESRTWGETMILNSWAVAESTGDPVAAERHLRVARQLGTELSRTRGERMLIDAVEVIQRAAPEARKALARGHIAFHDGQAGYRVNKASTAHPLFVQAADDLERGGSPVALLARYFAANTTYDLSRVEEARGVLEQLLASAPARYPAHRAQLQWQLGRYYGLDGRWGEGLAMLADSAAGFDRLGEKMYAAAVRDIRAGFYDRIGEPERAWAERMPALQTLGRQFHNRLLIAISSLSRLAFTAGDWDQASSLLEIELEVCRRAGTPMRRVEMMLLRAQLNARRDSLDRARLALDQARSQIAQLNDPALSSLMEDEALVVEASLATRPPDAVELLTKAIQSFQPRGRRVFLPGALLQRGRAYLAAGNRVNAAADFEAGIVELEAGRNSLPPGDERLGILDSVENLFGEAVSLALADGDPRRAFSYAERARARQLRDMLKIEDPPEGRLEELPAGTVILEYATLDDRLVIFIAGDFGVKAVEHPVSRGELADAVSAFTQVIRKNDRERTRLASRMLHGMLIGPVSSMLPSGPGSRVVIVPDRVVSGVAFTALTEPSGRYLIQRHELVVSPSAAVYLALRQREAPITPDARLLVVSNPARRGPEEQTLRRAEREGAAIAAMYRRPSTLSRQQATLAEFVRQAPGANVIHFAGHGIASGGRETALLFAETDDDDGHADAASLAALRLDSTAAVILAACDSANGQARGSEGTISVARAFLAAGVPSVIATLQRIGDDDAALFFTQLHRKLLAGATPAAALRAVQLEWIDRPENNIATWAAVQSMGR